MFYKFNQAAGRVQASESALSAQAAAPSVGEVTHIPAYKAGTGGGSGLSQVKALQAFFKVTGHDAPVHLRGARDQLIYRGVMGLSVVGIAVTFYGIYLMATGTMPKKERR